MALMVGQYKKNNNSDESGADREGWQGNTFMLTIISNF